MGRGRSEGQGEAENQEAARRLLALGLLNAAASRLYYSMFQAAVHALVRRSGAPAEAQRGARAWSHGRVEGLVAGIRGQPEDQVLFQELRALRERADYDRESPAKREIDRCWPDAERFVLQVTS